MVNKISETTSTTPAGKKMTEEDTNGNYCRCKSGPIEPDKPRQIKFNLLGDPGRDPEVLAIISNNKLNDQNKRPNWYGATAPNTAGGNGARNQKTGGEDESDYAVSDIIGNFGLFQFLVLLFSGLREASVGYDAIVMSIVLQPETNFYCAQNLGPPIFGGGGAGNATSSSSSIAAFNDTAQCFRSGVDGRPMVDLLGGGQMARCESWVFPGVAGWGESMVADWSLVCHQHWLVAFIESAYFFGLVTGNLVWGYYADKLGRRRAYLIAHTMALFAGWAAVFVPTIELFALCRYLSAFGSISYNVIYSIQVELIGTKYRSFSTILNHFGWGLGVICVPLADHLFPRYRYIIAVAPVLTLIMFPMAFWLPESPRWLMANDEYIRAKQELYRAAKFNGKRITPSLDKRISLLKQRIRNDMMKQEAENDKKSYQLLFTSPKLIRDTIILAYVSFIGHLFYYLLTINFAYMKNLSIQANFITSGAGEWVSCVVGAILLKFFTRKTCMSIFAFLVSSSFLFQCIIDSGVAPNLDTPLIITTNNGIGTLSALLMIFIALIVNQEVYPTVIRQTGSSIVNTLGESGSTLAPLLIHLARLIGPWRADVIYASACAVAVVGVQFITKTDGMELLDT